MYGQTELPRRRREGQGTLLEGVGGLSSDRGIQTLPAQTAGEEEERLAHFVLCLSCFGTSRTGSCM